MRYLVGWMVSMLALALSAAHLIDLAQAHQQGTGEGAFTFLVVFASLIAVVGYMIKLLTWIMGGGK